MYQNKIQSSKSKIQNNFKNIQKKIITAWRYPGVSPIQDKIPIPEDILEQVNDLIK